ncbi:hypothetical protein [Brevundimonas sp. FT23028]|uniref:hypothetical protein n=1 Tax=Brevundimonas sp. FT23028 TaxID=3393748 RepID=UPI003B5897C6
MTDPRPSLSPLLAPPPETPKWRTAGAAVACGLLYGLVVYGLVRWQAPDSGMLLIAFLLGAPIAACGIAVAVSDPRGVKGVGSHASTSALTVTIMLVCAGVVLREGAVCLVMAGPIFYGVGILGGVVGGAIMRQARGRLLGLSLLVLPLIGVPVEADRPPQPETRQVETRIHIDAAPEVVWARMIDIRQIGADEHRWNFSHDIVGIPRPKDARMEGAGVGAVRRLEWADGVRFEEHITGWAPGRELVWTFHIAPEAQTRMLDEHLRVDSDYLKLEEGRYRIEPTADGGSDLVLTTRYWIRTPINSYAAFWGGIFLGDFHRNVLGVIRDRAEADGQDTGHRA